MRSVRAIAVGVLCLALTRLALAAETLPNRRIVGVPPTDINGSSYIRGFFRSESLASARLQPDEIRIRIVHRNLRSSAPSPSSEGIAAEIRGIVGEGGRVLADHDHGGFDWKDRALSAAEFQEAVDAVRKEEFLATPVRIRPYALGASQFYIEVAARDMYACFFADMPRCEPEMRGLIAFGTVASSLFRLAHYSPDEISWGPTTEETRLARERAERSRQLVEAERASLVMKVDAPPAHKALAEQISRIWTLNHHSVLDEYPRGFEMRVLIACGPDGRVSVHSFEGEPKEQTRRAIVRATLNAFAPPSMQDSAAGSLIRLTFVCRKLPQPDSSR